MDATRMSDVVQVPPVFPENRLIREGDKKPRKVKVKRPTWRERLRPVVITALFWYVLTSVAGAALLSVGVALEHGIGYGLIVLGAASLFGSQVIRRGMTSA